MRSSRLFLGTALLVAAGPLAGCADPPQPVAPEQPAPAQPVAAPDLAPVAEPADIFSTVRWKSFNATVHAASGCAGLPSEVVDGAARALLEKDFQKTFGEPGKELASIVAYDAPVDYVVSLDPGRRSFHAFHAFAVGLSSIEGAKAAAGATPHELAPGLWQVPGSESSKLTCAVGPAAGPVPARLVCAQSEADIAALGPYLTRNMAVAPMAAADIRAEVNFQPLVARFDEDIRRSLGFLPNLAQTQNIGDARFDRALGDAAVALKDEGIALMADLDRARLDFSVDPDKCLTAALSVQMKGTASFISSSLAERTTHQGPPPAFFWRLPKDASSATYSHGSDPAKSAGMVRTLRHLLEGKLGQLKVGSEADRKALSNLLEAVMIKHDNTVLASGSSPDPNAPVASPSDGSQKMFDSLMKGQGSWTILGFDESPEAITKFLKDLVNVWGRKGLVDPLKKITGHAEAYPTARLGPGHPQLGKGSQDLEIKFKIDPKKAKLPEKAKLEVSIHVLLMSDGKNTWLAFGVDKDKLVKELLTVKNAPESQTLAARSDLAPLRSQQAISNGFISLGSVTKSMINILSNPAMQAAGKGQDFATIVKALENLPHHGQTPIFISSVKGAEGAASVETKLEIQKGTFEDLGSALMVGLGPLLHSAGSKP